MIQHSEFHVVFFFLYCSIVTTKGLFLYSYCCTHSWYKIGSSGLWVSTIDSQHHKHYNNKGIVCNTTLVAAPICITPMWNNEVKEWLLYEVVSTIMIHRSEFQVEFLMQHCYKMIVFIVALSTVDVNFLKQPTMFFRY